MLKGLLELSREEGYVSYRKYRDYFPLFPTKPTEKGNTGVKLGTAVGAYVGA